ncbi:MAG: hypothetical protein R2729_07810 [Bryobacteraceae bacterium]
MWPSRTAAALALILGAGCGFSPKKAPAVGEAFVAPSSLQLHADLAPRSPVTVTVKHGERVELLANRRRFALVRAADGSEGWTDGRQLISAKTMAAVRAAHEQGKTLPSQGRIVAFDLVNVHIAPNRLSPSFHQLTEDAPAELIERKVTARVPYNPDPKTTAPAPAEGTLKDDWARVRLPDGRSGWVLARMTMMDLPDEVTQYANGHRITAAFPMGAVIDGQGVTHESWLWMTMADPPEHHQFEAIRYSSWNPKRNRYETRILERGLIGHYPVTVEPAARGVRNVRAITEKDGSLIRRTLAFTNGRMRVTATEPWTFPAPPPEGDRAISYAGREPSTWERLRKWLRGDEAKPN